MNIIITDGNSQYYNTIGKIIHVYEHYVDGIQQVGFGIELHDGKYTNSFTITDIKTEPLLDGIHRKQAEKRANGYS